MRRIVVGAVLALALAPVLGAQDDKNKAQPGTPAGEFKALVEEQAAVIKGRSDALKKAKTNEERVQVLQGPEGKLASEKIMGFPGRFLDLAKKYPKDPIAMDALAKVIGTRKVPEAGQALEIVQKDHLLSPGVGAVCEMVGFYPAPTEKQPFNPEKFLREVLEKNTHADAQGYAAFALATMLKNRAMRGKPSPDEEAKLNAEAEKLFDRVLTKHAALKNSREKALGDLAKGNLNELRHLMVGKVVLDIEGEDLDAKKFKLSDYRGKVVLLDFWGHW